MAVLARKPVFIRFRDYDCNVGRWSPAVRGYASDIQGKSATLRHDSKGETHLPLRASPIVDSESLLVKWRSGITCATALLLLLAIAAAASAGRQDDRLLEAVKSADPAGIRQALADGANPNQWGPEGNPPLFWAAAAGNGEAVELLLAGGADVNRAGRPGSTPLMAAASWGHTAIVKRLLDAGARVDAVNDAARSALFIAAATGRIQVAKLLLERGADVHTRDRFGYTPFVRACNHGLTNIAKLLLDHGAQIDARNSNDQTALMLASYRGVTELVKLLLERGADPNTADRYGRTALMLASLTGYPAVVKLLLEKGASVSTRDTRGRTALSLASGAGHTDVVTALLEHGADATEAHEKGPSGLTGAASGAPEPGRRQGEVIVAEPAVKIEQLVGDYDRQLKRATRNRTFTRYQLNTTDLGVPFRHKGRTYLLFGDTSGINGGDAIGYTSDTSPEDGLDLEFVRDNQGAYKPVIIPRISQDGFEVPMEGTSVDGKMYIYHTTDHCRGRTMGRSVVAVSEDDGKTFRYLYDFSNRHFINVSIVETNLSAVDGFPQSTGTGLVIFGSGPYRKSDVRLAFQPADTLESPKTLRYFSGLDESSRPLWSPKEEDARPLFHQPCVGELSVTYNRFIKKWIMLYNCGRTGQTILMRTADLPWGPWSEPQTIFKPSESNGLCQFIHKSWKSKKCDVLQDPGRQNDTGDCYGAYQFEDLATGDDLSTTIYFTLSTWNPYTVVLMKTTLRKTLPEKSTDLPIKPDQGKSTHADP